MPFSAAHGQAVRAPPVRMVVGTVNGDTITTLYEADPATGVKVLSIGSVGYQLYWV